MERTETSGTAVIMVPLDEWNTALQQIGRISETIEQMGNAGKKELLTPKEVCEMLKIGRTTFDRYVREGTLIPVKINQRKYSKVYINRGEIEKMIHDANS